VQTLANTPTVHTHKHNTQTLFGRLVCFISLPPSGGVQVQNEKCYRRGLSCTIGLIKYIRFYSQKMNKKWNNKACSQLGCTEGTRNTHSIIAVHSPYVALGIILSIRISHQFINTPTVIFNHFFILSPINIIRIRSHKPVEPYIKTGVFFSELVVSPTFYKHK